MLIPITWLGGMNMQNNGEDSSTDNVFNLFRNTEYIINGKYIESIDYVRITTTIKNLLKFSDDYSRSGANSVFWFEDKIR